jgi:hypothetical protein
MLEGKYFFKKIALSITPAYITFHMPLSGFELAPLRREARPSTIYTRSTVLEGKELLLLFFA